MRELADFLDRSPGSISFHLGNVAAAKSPGRGLANAGKVFRTVVARYRGHPSELQQEAARLRRAKFGRLTSPRLERELTAEEARVAEVELTRRFPEARLPADAIILYRYRGSVWVGVMAAIQTALLWPDETRAALRIAIDVLGATVRRNPAAESVLDGRTLELAEKEISDRAPLFHYSDLSPLDRVKLALLLPKLKSLRRWRPNARRIEFFAGPDLRAERARIQTYFHIDASRLSHRDLQMLLDALEEGLTSGRL